ncbi:unnamed protein product [Paramecium sonneborni]|uniref:FCP1 homology domain-containing protein n=1 Tax=Paramecium sonneborni TaxID=65129 RepID=A0A8S1NPK4_9CILI|nr:unnamed protein product [Paramecium sonneborni]
MFYSRSNPKLSDYQNKLNTSQFSNKSRGSFKEISPETRNITPNNLNRPLTARNEYTNPQKVKQMLNNLIQGDQSNTSSTMVGQNIFQKKQIEIRSSRGDSLLSSRISNFGKQYIKSPQNNETFLKSAFIVPDTNRDQDRKPHQNLYYLSNKQNDSIGSQKKSNKNSKVLTISQIAQQCKKNSITPTRQNTINNENCNNLNNLNQKINNHQQNKQQQILIAQVGSNKKNTINYMETFNILKQKFDYNNVQSNQNSGKKQNEKSVNVSPLKSPKSKIENTKIASSQMIDDVTQQNIYKSLLYKEQLWNDIIIQLDNPNKMTLATKCTQLLKQIRLISEKNNSEYLFRMEPHTLEIFLYESFACYLLVSDYLQDQINEDHNIKNLIQYIISSNLYVLQVLENATSNQINLNLLKQRIDLRTFNIRKVCPKGKQALSKNNFIIKSILGLMIDEITRPQIFMILSRITTTPDQYIIQQKKINQQIEQIMPLDLERALVVSNKEYTLVLDLDETLVHYQEFPKGGGQFLVRPFAEEFLESVSKYYEIFIFTAALPDYANFIIDIIDKKGVVKQRLYRDKTIFKDQVYIKDLSILNRSLSKVIIVDNMPENFQLQPENGIYIQSWFGDTKDRALKDLQPLLEQIAIKKCKDIRVALNQFRQQMIERVQMGIKNPYQYLQLN